LTLRETGQTLVIWHDLLSSFRTLRRRPFYPIVTVVILALGLSAGIAVFTYINGFYHPFPGADADRLVRIFGSEPDELYRDISYLDFLDYAEQTQTFERLAAAQPYYAASVRHENQTEVAFLEAVSGDYFSVLGMQLTVGRGITPDDDRPGTDAAAVISYDWWLRSFNADPAVIGSTLFLNFRSFTIVGVMSPEFLGTASDFRPDVWIPLAPFRDRYTRWAAMAENRDVPLVRVYGRLYATSSVERAQAELGALAAGLDEAFPRADASRQPRLEPATWIDPRARMSEWTTVRLMMVAAAGLLVLVCANVANLLLSVAVGRQRDTSLRAALGASPKRLLRQVLIENVILSGAAGAIGLALAAPLAVRLGSYFARPSVWGANVPRETSIDIRVVLFAIIISILTGLIAGLLPALRASRRNLADTLKTESAVSGSGPPRAFGIRIPGLRDGLLSAQVALSVMLLVVAGLVLRTFSSVSGLDPGFSYDQLIVTHISTSSTTLEVSERDQFFRETARLVAEEPWVSTATVADFPLLSPHPSAEFDLDPGSNPVSVVYSRVIPGFFEALGIDVVRGRSFEPADTAGAFDAAMINERLAARYFPDVEPVGRRFAWPSGDDGAAQEFEIVGVVRDTKTRDYFSDPEPTIYFSYPQHAYPTGSALLVAVRGDPRESVVRLQHWLREWEPHLAIVNVIPYRDVVRGFMYTQRMNAELFSVLALLGLGLAAVGVFSVMSLAVSRRTREIGVRMSIGAQRSDIGRLVIGKALTPVVIGLVIGLAGSFAVTGLVRGLLFGVEPTDPVSLFGGAAVLIFASLLAAYIPARRATSVDPVEALRVE
jgi:predicted permease